MNNIEEVFDKFDDEFLKFKLVENKLNNRPEVHAFILLDSLVPGTEDMVSAAEHDEIFLSIETEDLAASHITEDQVCELVRCGVRIGDGGYLAMFV